PIFCPKCEADEEREKIVSMELSDEDVEIFCEGMRDVEGLGVDLQIEQDEREVFGLESPAVGPSDWDQPEVEGNDYYVPSVEDIPPNFSWTFANVYKVPSGAQQAEVCCNLLFPGGCSCPACLDVKDMVGSNAQFVLEDIAGSGNGRVDCFGGPTASQPMESSAQAVSPQIVSTPEARSPAARSPLVANEERVDGWTTVLSAAEVLAGMKEGGIPQQVAEMVVGLFPRAVKPPSSTGSGTSKGGSGGFFVLPLSLDAVGLIIFLSMFGAVALIIVFLRERERVRREFDLTNLPPPYVLTVEEVA
ncbi:hypothetical protein BDZ91DRAFT_769119, partial [Kalaharituber pfeilii]